MTPWWKTVWRLLRDQRRLGETWDEVLEIGGRRQGPRQRKVNKVRGLVVVCRQSATADANQSPATLNVSAGPRRVEWPIRQSPSAPIPVKPAAREVGRKGTFAEGVSPRSPRNFNQNPCPRKHTPDTLHRSQAWNGRGSLHSAIPSPPDPQSNMENPICSLGVFGQRSRMRSGLGISRPTCASVILRGTSVFCTRPYTSKSYRPSPFSAITLDSGMSTF